MTTQKFILSALLCGTSLAVSAQSLRLTQGEVTYVHSAANTGDMKFVSNRLTVEGKQYTLDDATTMEVSADGTEDNTVSVVYNGSEASVVVAGNIAKYLTVNASGANVSIVASDELQQNVRYTLGGSTSNGSFYMDGKYAATFVFSNLNITNPDSAAVNIQDGKHIKVELEGNSELADGTNSTANTCLFINGHSTFTGSGYLSVQGLAKHGITADENMTIENGNINVTAAADGLHVKEYFKQTGGNVTIKSVSDGIDVSFRGANKGTKDQYANNGFAMFEGGTIDISATGDAAKGIKADSTVTVTGAKVAVTTSGCAVYDTTDNDISSSAALKTGGGLTVASGTLTLTSTGDGGKGVNATGDIEVSGGEMYVTTTGSTWTYGNDDTKPQGVKTDGNIYLKGGKVMVAASADSGTAFKTDYYFVISGGTIMGIGGKASKPTSATQAYNTYTKVNVVGGKTLSYNGVSYTIPAIYSNSSAKVLVSGGN